MPINEWMDKEGKKTWLCTHTQTHMQWNTTQPYKRRNLAICNNRDGPWGCYAKWNNSDRCRQILYDFTPMWNKKSYKQTKAKSRKKIKQKQTHRHRVVVTRGEGMDSGGRQWDGKADYLYGDRWKVSFWWWAHCRLYRSRDKILYTRNI